MVQRYSLTALICLGALTIHLSLLSSVLFISRTSSPEQNYNASSAVIMTELVKILLAIAIMFGSGELESSVQEFRRSEQGINEKDHGQVQGQLRSPRSPDHTHFETSHRRRNLSPAALVEVEGQDSSSTYRFRLSRLFVRDYWMVLVQMVKRGMGKVALPAVLFAFQANIAYIASSNLSVPVSQLLYQLKIPATALCSVLLLNRKLSLLQWISLFTLTLGVGILLRASDTSIGGGKEGGGRGGEEMNTFLGTSAIIASCLSSGFASTYFERLLRIDSSLSPHDSARPSLWIRNVQLSLWGLSATLPLALRQLYLAVSSSSSFGLGEAGEEGSRILEIMGNEFFKGFNRITWLVILLQVIGGLLGALVIQYSDNIAKGFATSSSILLSIGCSIWFFNFQLSANVFIGAFCVLGSTALFSRPSSSPPRHNS